MPSVYCPDCDNNRQLALRILRDAGLIVGAGSLNPVAASIAGAQLGGRVAEIGAAMEDKATNTGAWGTPQDFVGGSGAFPTLPEPKKKRKVGRYQREVGKALRALKKKHPRTAQKTLMKKAHAKVKAKRKREKW